MDFGARFFGLARRQPSEPFEPAPPSRFTLFLRRVIVRVSERRLLRNGELVLFLFLIAATGLYGAVRGGHAEALLGALHEVGDAAARAAGFAITHVEIHGAEQVAHDAVLRQAGVTETSSLLLLNAERARAELKDIPWITEASVRKLYPNRLDITVEERDAFARWQHEGKLHLIAQDGAVLESDIGLQRSDLPLVVGAGAEKRAAAFLSLIDRFPTIRAELRAGILVAERRWNLRLNNGIDVRLPEEDPTLALRRLVALNREKQLLSRDVTVIDLRLPDQVTVRLSDEAMKARTEKEKPARRGANS